MIPVVAIVGRPNVGKSSLANMLAGRKMSIVDPTPGTTRDRVSSVVELPSPDNRTPSLKVELLDTGGFGIYTAPGEHIDDAGKDLRRLTGDIEHQIARAVESADLILFVIDAQAGLVPADEIVAKLLREGGLGRAKEGKPNVVMVANKCDGPRWEAHAMEAAALGFGQPLLVSAKNNYLRRELSDALHEKVAELLQARLKARPSKALDQREDIHKLAKSEMHIAIVGKRNAGKSTLVNTLAGEDRVIVSEIAGTTRDAVDVRFELDGKAFVAIDTAGLRKKKSFASRIEWFALDRLQRAVNRSDVALILIDATVPISQVDQQIARMVVSSYRPAVIVVNKWDLAEGQPLAQGSGAPGAKDNRPVTPEDYEHYLRTELKGLDFAPIVFISAARSTNIRGVIDTAFAMFEQASTRETTGRLNRLLKGIIESQGPSNKIGSFARVFFTTQIATNPPTIACVVNKPELFTPNYQRFLLNRFRQELPFPEVPIKLIIRGRKREEPLEQTAQRPESEHEAATLKEASAYFDEPVPSMALPAHLLASEGEDVDLGELDIDDADDFAAKPAPSPKPARRPEPAPASPRLSRRAERAATKPTRGKSPATGASRGSSRGATKRAGKPAKPARASGAKPKKAARRK